jgi:hypothetical protein
VLSWKNIQLACSHTQILSKRFRARIVLAFGLVLGRKNIFPVHIFRRAVKTAKCELGAVLRSSFCTHFDVVLNQHPCDMVLKKGVVMLK